MGCRILPKPGRSARPTWRGKLVSMDSIYVVSARNDDWNRVVERARRCGRDITLDRATGIHSSWSSSQAAMACWEQANSHSTLNGEKVPVGVALDRVDDHQKQQTTIEMAWQSRWASARWRGNSTELPGVVDHMLKWDTRQPSIHADGEADGDRWQYSFPNDEWVELFGENLIGHRIDGTANSPVRVVFPGAFDPMHDGHRGMVDCAERQLGETVELEISVRNVDKPPLDFFEINRRLESLAQFRPCWLTRAPTFLEKARLFPAATFVVGDDTIRRIWDGRYYVDEAAKTAAHRELLSLECRFLIFGRQHGASFRTVKPEELPAEFRSACDVVPESEFRIDVNSTSIREDR